MEEKKAKPSARGRGLREQVGYPLLCFSQVWMADSSVTSQADLAGFLQISTAHEAVAMELPW